jgi:hypothetical protein
LRESRGGDAERQDRSKGDGPPGALHRNLHKTNDVQRARPAARQESDESITLDPDRMNENASFVCEDAGLEPNHRFPI